MLISPPILVRTQIAFRLNTHSTAKEFEAMLSMVPPEQKRKAISEYFRVLKPRGRLATHDLLLRKNPQTPPIQEQLQTLRRLLMVNAQPMTEEGWRSIFEEMPFQNIDHHTGKICLLTLKGLLIDEGWEGLMTILRNATNHPKSQQYLFELISCLISMMISMGISLLWL